MQRIIQAFLAALALASVPTARAERENPNTDWFRDAGWGLFVHWLWDGKDWADVAAEYSKHYGAKVHGWWVDGCYTHIDYNDHRWDLLARGLKAANPKAIIALNNPSMSHANSSSDHALQAISAYNYRGLSLDKTPNIDQHLRMDYNLKYPADNTWELFDLEKDPKELKSVYDDPAYADIRKELTAKLDALKQQYANPIRTEAEERAYLSKLQFTNPAIP